MQSEYQMSLSSRTTETAEPRARAVLDAARSGLGFIPNMYAVMANSPGLLEAYATGYAAFREASGFTPAEQEVVLLTVSHENGCEYCVAAHSFLSDQVSKVPPEVTSAIRLGGRVPHGKLGALSNFTRIMVATRGLPSRRQVIDFLAAGYTEQQILEVVLAIAVKTLSNYTNHLFHTRLDSVFAGSAWSETTLGSRVA